MLKIALIDDHKMIASAIKEALTGLPGIDEICIFNQADKYFNRGDSWQPDIIITDMLMPGTNGLDMIKKLKDSEPEGVKIIVLSSVIDVPVVKQAIRMGINGYLSKEADVEELIEGIQIVAEEGQYISRQLSQKLVKNIFVEEQFVHQLSPRETEVLRLVCAGNSMKEVAFELNITLNTAQSYHKNVMKKLNVNKTVDLIVYAIEAGLYIPKKK